MVAATGLSRSVIQRIWREHGLKPHLMKTFKVSNDPRFEEKLRDVVGLYLNPPEHALVLSVDEKIQIQALGRTQKSLVMFPGRLGTMTHDYKRNGTTTLFAALNVADGRVVAGFSQRHRHNEWLAFLRTLDETYPDVELHIICDNYSTHKHEKVRRWLKRRPRIHVHFTPTSSSGLNQIERWFRDLTDRCIRRGSELAAVRGHRQLRIQNPQLHTETSTALHQLRPCGISKGPGESDRHPRQSAA